MPLLGTDVGQPPDYERPVAVEDATHNEASSAASRSAQFATTSHGVVASVA
jgi:hypothetical protein